MLLRNIVVERKDRNKKRVSREKTVSEYYMMDDVIYCSSLTSYTIQLNVFTFTQKSLHFYSKNSPFGENRQKQENGGFMTLARELVTRTQIDLIIGRVTSKLHIILSSRLPIVYSSIYYNKLTIHIGYK